MVITAKFNSRCAKCGGLIQPGAQIEWERGSGSWHVKCPAKTATASAPATAPITLYQSGQSKYDAPAVGTAMRARNYGIVTVLSVRSQYIREDGMSFGLNDDSGYRFTIGARLATDVEAAPVLAREAEIRAKREAQEQIRKIADRIPREGEKPEGENTPEGERVLDTQTIYGGGSWFVIGRDYIWFVRNNGADGDDWSRNNVRTGGAGAIGWRIPFDEALAAQIKAAAAVIGG